MTSVAFDDVGHRGAHIVWIVSPGDPPPTLGAGGKITEHLDGKAAKQVAFVLEVDVEAGARNAGLGRQPIHAELGETGALAHQPLGGVQQPALHVLAALLARYLRLAGHRWHTRSIPDVSAY